MKKRILPLKKSIFTRMLLFFLSFVIPIYGLGYGLYFWGKSVIRNQMNQSQINEIDTYMGNLENEMERIQNLQYNFFFESSLNMLSDEYQILSNYNRDQMILNTESWLTSIKNSSQYIDETTVLMPAIGKKLSAEYFEDMSDDDRALMKAINGQKVSNAFLWNGKLLLNADEYPEYDSTGNYKFYFVIALSDTALEASMRQFSLNGSHFILFRESTDFSLTSDSDPDFVKQLIAYVRRKKSSVREQIVTIRDVRYFVYSSFSKYMDLQYITYVPYDRIFGKINQLAWLFSLFTALTLFFSVLYALYLNRKMNQPLTKLLHAFRKVELGEVHVEIQHNTNDEFQYIFEGFNRMTRELSTLIDQVYKQKILIQKAQLKQLQSQINPHFLFNCFFILRRRIKYGDLDTASRLADHLGTYFQFITRNTSDTIPLSREVEHARIYTEIQSSRFSNRIQVDFQQLPPEYEQVEVERLILQPLIENAFQYGLEDKEADGRLCVSFRREETLLVITVEDNGSRLTDEVLERQRALLYEQKAAGELTAIANIHRRLQYRFGAKSGIRLSRGEMGGLKSEIVLDLTGAQPALPGPAQPDDAS